MTTALQLQAGPLQWARGHCRRTARASDLAAASNFNLVFITLLFHHYLLETRNFELSKIFSLSANIFQLHLSNYIAGGAESANRAALCRGQTTDLLFIMAQNWTTLKNIIKYVLFESIWSLHLMIPHCRLWRSWGWWSSPRWTTAWRTRRRGSSAQRWKMSSTWWLQQVDTRDREPVTITQYWTVQ